MKLNWSRGTGYKKYKVVLTDTKANTKKTIQFGDNRYGQFSDKTPLRLYSHKNHNDRKRKKAYYNRHKINYPKYSADWFSKKYLW